MTQGVGCRRYTPRLMLGVDLTKMPLDNAHFLTPGPRNQKYSAPNLLQATAILFTFRIRLERS
jgi:hypothetical protein